MTGNLIRPYMHGYKESSQHMATRTAEQFADLLLPNLAPGMRALDVGCGPGTITIGIAQVVAPGRVTGIDIAESEVKRAAKNAQEAGAPNVDFEQGDAAALRFDDETFDAVFSSAVVEHVEDKAGVLAQFMRVLKPGGVLCLVGGAFRGHLFGPMIPESERIMEIFHGLAANTNMEPDFGLRQASVMLELGFIDIVQRPWYLDDSGSNVYEQRFRNDDFISRAEALGVSSRVEMIHLADRLKDWQEAPDHFAYLAWIKTIGRKPA